MATLILRTSDILPSYLCRHLDDTLVLQRISMSMNSELQVVLPSRTFEHFSSQEIFRPNDSESPFTMIRAELKSSVGPNLDVVLKVSMGGLIGALRLTRERDVYETHGESLVSCIPKFYGLFETADKQVICLITAYCGEPLPRPLRSVDRALLWKVITKAAELHESGFQHGELAPRNILHNETTGEIRFIDLMLLKPHKCERKLRIKIDCMIPDHEEFGCRELRALVQLSGLWKSNHLDFLGQFPVLIFSIRTVEDVLFNVPPLFMETEEQRETLRKAAEEFLKMVPQMIPEQSPSIQDCPTSEDVI